MNKFKVRLLKESNIKVTKTVLPHKFKESEYEELIRLRAEITYLRLKMKLKKLCDLSRKSCDYQNAPQQGYQLKHLQKTMPMFKYIYYFELSRVNLVNKNGWPN